MKHTGDGVRSVDDLEEAHAAAALAADDDVDGEHAGDVGVISTKDLERGEARERGEVGDRGTVDAKLAELGEAGRGSEIDDGVAVDVEASQRREARDEVEVDEAKPLQPEVLERRQRGEQRGRRRRREEARLEGAEGGRAGVDDLVVIEVELLERGEERGEGRAYPDLSLTRTVVVLRV